MVVSKTPPKFHTKKLFPVKVLFSKKIDNLQWHKKILSVPFNFLAKTASNALNRISLASRESTFLETGVEAFRSHISRIRRFQTKSFRFQTILGYTNIFGSKHWGVKKSGVGPLPFVLKNLTDCLLNVKIKVINEIRLVISVLVKRNQHIFDITE